MTIELSYIFGREGHKPLLDDILKCTRKMTIELSYICSFFVHSKKEKV